MAMGPVVPVDVSPEESLAKCRDLIETALEKKRIDPQDPLIVRANAAIVDLESAITTRNRLRRQVLSLESSSNVENDRPFVAQVQNFMSRFSLLRKDKSVDCAQKALAGAETVVKELHTQIQEYKLFIENTSTRRSPHNPMGSFYSLAECQMLVAKDKAGFGLKGRYAESGAALYLVASDILNAGKLLEDRNKKASRKSRGKEGNILSHWIMVQNRLAVICDGIISYMVIAPFDNRTHENTIEDTSKAVEYLQDFASGDKSVSLEVLEQQIDSIERYMKANNENYLKRAKKFTLDDESSDVRAEQRSFDHLNLKKGDLSDTPLVVRRMSDRPESKCLELPILYSKPGKPGTAHSGGYGCVYRTFFPEDVALPNDSVRLKDIKASKCPVAVKIVTKYATVAEANLRMLREAESWMAVRRDSETLSSGVEYIAEVLGIWDNFLDQRPGLVSLWGDCDLSVYLRDSKPSAHERVKILHKIAQGLNFLHTRRRKVIVHGDLKPSNVIMVDGNPLLTDFGVAKCLEGVQGYTTGNSYTDGYRAPELQYRSISLERYPTTMSDVYAFGCVIFETISGKSPYDGCDSDPNVRRHWIEQHDDCTPVEAESIKPKGTPFDFDRRQLKLLNKCFSFHASKRPLMSEVVQDLDEQCLVFED